MYKLLIGVFVLTGLALADDDSPETNRWAAVAHSRSASRIGRAYSEANEAIAKEIALRNCGVSDCEIVTYVQRGCIGIAIGYDEMAHRWRGFGATLYARRIDETILEAKNKAELRAGELAINGCEIASHRSCTFSEVLCTWSY